MNKAFITPSDLHNSLQAAITQNCAEADYGLPVSRLLENGSGLNAAAHTHTHEGHFSCLEVARRCHNGCIFSVRPQVLPASHMVTHGIGSSGTHQLS